MSFLVVNRGISSTFQRHPLQLCVIQAQSDNTCKPIHQGYPHLAGHQSRAPSLAALSNKGEATPLSISPVLLAATLRRVRDTAEVAGPCQQQLPILLNTVISVRCHLNALRSLTDAILQVM